MNRVPLSVKNIVPLNSAKGYSRFRLNLRLEDVIALTFFLINLLVYAIFGGAGRKDRPVWEAVGLGVISVTILLFITLIRQAIAPPKKSGSERSAGLKEFTIPYAAILRDWFPFLFILAMYYSLWGDATHLLVTQDRDAALIALDQRIFGFQASVSLQRIASPALTAWMKFAYDSHPFLTPLVALFVYLKRPRAKFREMMSGLMVISFFGFLIYLLVPAIGPIYTLKDRYYVDLGPMQFMDYVKIRRDVFPSLHVGISFLVWMYAWRNSRWLFSLLAPVMLSLWFSTVYLRQHYLIDVVAGMALAPLCFQLANWLFARFGEEPLTFSIPAPEKQSLP